LAEIAPNYEAMRQAIAECQRVDEIAHLRDMAIAAQAYFRQSLDVENEMGASRIRLRAERRLGEIGIQMRENGQRRSAGNPQFPREGGIGVALADLGIPSQRMSQAMQLARVPEAEFEAALAEPRVAEPRRILREQRERQQVSVVEPEPQLVPIRDTLRLWGMVREFAQYLESGQMPPLSHWRYNMQPFQITELRQYIPRVVEYLNAIREEIDNGRA
jgi:hypothetical protein